MDLLSVIQRRALREHVSIREIARRTNLSRKTNRKYMRSGEVEPKFGLGHGFLRHRLALLSDQLEGGLKFEVQHSPSEFHYRTLPLAF